MPGFHDSVSRPVTEVSVGAKNGHDSAFGDFGLRDSLMCFRWLNDGH